MKGQIIRICICGGGSLGHVCCGVLASRDNTEVSLLTGHPGSWSGRVSVTDPSGKVFDAAVGKVSSAPEDVVPGQDIILLTVPGYLIEKTLEDIKPYIGKAAVGAVVSSTGFFFFAHRILESGTPLFGFHRVPFISRVAEYGKSALLLGYKQGLTAVLENVDDRESFRKTLQDLFLTPVSLAENYLEVSLTNSNPILHTGRLYTMFKGREEQVFDHNILFYREWTDEASDMLIRMDGEFFRLLDKLGISSIPSLLDYYESTDAASLTRKISSIPAFSNITSPMVPVPGGWKADFTSRYFTEDFPFGLRWIKELAKENNVNTPCIDTVYQWGTGRL